MSHSRNHSQNEVIEFLRRPSSYPRLPSAFPDAVRVVETHAALVFLAGDEAYKIKKDIVYPYLDFGSLEKRRQACLRELSINQPHAPNIYLNVVPITRETTGELKINGAGVAVEWAVHMRRFCEDDLLARALESGRLNPQFFDRLADEILRYHDASPKVISSTGQAKMIAIVRQLNAAFKAVAHMPQLEQDETGRFASLAEIQLKKTGTCLDDRSRRGYVRRCHGDLHLENIVVLEGLPVLFDAIEFNDEIATIDVLYDLAFLLMDLGHRSLGNRANQILNRYLAKSENIYNLEGLKALPLFLGCRAGIRAMVISSRIEQGHGNAGRSEYDEMLAYFHAALDFLNPAPPRLIAVGGFSGTGKTTVAQELAPAIGDFPGAVHLRTDIERKALFGVGETTRLPPETYTRAASEKVYHRVMKKAEAILAAGRSVVADAAFLDPHERSAIEELARDACIPFTGLWLDADEEILVRRVSARQGDASDATADIVRRQRAAGAGDLAWHRIDAGGSSEQTLATARQITLPDRGDQN